MLRSGRSRTFTSTKAPVLYLHFTSPTSKQASACKLRCEAGDRCRTFADHSDRLVEPDGSFRSQSGVALEG